MLCGRADFYWYDREEAQKHKRKSKWIDRTTPDRQSLNTTYLQVTGNGGAIGLDKIGVEFLGDYLREHIDEFLNGIKQWKVIDTPLNLDTVNHSFKRLP